MPIGLKETNIKTIYVRGFKGAHLVESHLDFIRGILFGEFKVHLICYFYLNIYQKVINVMQRGLRGVINVLKIAHKGLIKIIRG